MKIQLICFVETHVKFVKAEKIKDGGLYLIMNFIIWEDGGFVEIR
jgi:hypothetical protein